MMRWTASPREPVSRSVPWSSAGTISSGRLRRRGDLVELLGRRRGGRVPHTRDEQLVRIHTLEQRGVRVQTLDRDRGRQGDHHRDVRPLLTGRDERGRAAHARAHERDGRRPLGPDEVDRPQHVLPDRRDLELALRAAAVAARAVPAEVVREDEVPLVGESVREREPRTLIGGLHVRQHDAGRSLAEQTALQRDAVAGLERDRPRTREIGRWRFAARPERDRAQQHDRDRTGPDRDRAHRSGP